MRILNPGRAFLLAFSLCSGLPSLSVAQELEKLSAPRLEAAEPGVRQVLEQARAYTQGLLAAEQREPGILALAFGELGRLYDAHLMLDAAAVCYRNAMRLNAADFRWPYYLGYLQQRSGDLEGAVEAYQMVLELRPDLAQARFRLGQAELELGQLEQAEALLEQSLTEPGLAGAAWFELGKLALARGQGAQAVERLERALTASPEASRIHYTLGMAYRSLGDLERARAQLALRGDVDPAVPDPLVAQLARLSSGQRMLYHLGTSAGQQREYAVAVRFFREGLALAPGNLDARVSLARFLYLDGDREGAGRELLEVLRLNPEQVLARFLLALWYAETGQREQAHSQLERVLEADPLHSGSHYYLAEMAAQSGNVEQAARHYALALEQAPDNSSARLRWILALIDLGSDDATLLALLQKAQRRHPEVESFSYLLSALLSSSPANDLRDGTRALILAKPLYRAYPSPEHAELLAMAYAESGAFAHARQMQGWAVAQATADGRWMLVSRLAANLERFEADRPCRSPWGNSPLLQQVEPASLSKPFRDYPTNDAY